MIECDNLVKIYKTPESEVFALQGLDLTVEKGEMFAIVGNSGSGKSTLMNLIGGLDIPTAGQLHVNDLDMTKMTDKLLTVYKRETVGFVWQNNSRNLIPYLSALENVELPMSFKHTRKRKQRALELLEIVGLSHRKHNKLHQLSGGEQQRIAIAIALSNNPPLLLADEPTGNVDSKTSENIMQLFRELNESQKITVVIVTHDPRVAKKVSRVIAIRDGRVGSEFLYSRSYRESVGELGAGFGTTERVEGLSDEDMEQKEWLAVDRHGRIQLPKEYMEHIGVAAHSRVEAKLEDGSIRIFGEEPAEDPAEK